MSGVVEPDVVPFRDFFYAFCAGNDVRMEIYPCHLEICDVYQAAICGALTEFEYFNVHMPRRVGKTMLLRALACWTLGEFDSAQMMYGCYSDVLVARTIRYVAQTIQRRWYRDLYGDMLHSGTTKSSRLVTTAAGGLVYGAGTTATAAGYGAGSKEPGGGYISLDDPANPTSALSKVEAANVIENFELTWKGCRNSDKFTPIIINAQRIGPDDLPGYVAKNYPTKTLTLKFPCFVRPGTNIGDPNGVSQFPDTWSDETGRELEKTRIGRFTKASQMQQEPVALGGNLIPVAQFGRFDVKEAAAFKFETIVITVDTALKVKEENDYSAAQAWGRLARRAYLFGQVWGKWESPELLENVITFYKMVRADHPSAGVRLVIEEKAAGTPLLQNLRKRGVPALGIERDIDKVRRVQNVLPQIESGLVLIPKEGSTPWVDGVVAECAEFKADMTHAHDDRVDCLADGINLTIGGAPSIFDALGAKPKR